MLLVLTVGQVRRDTIRDDRTTLNIHPSLQRNFPRPPSSIPQPSFIPLEKHHEPTFLHGTRVEVVHDVALLSDMEIGGVASGISGLFGACMDVLERIEADKEFGLESQRAVTQFKADKLRLKKWANGVGISDENWKEIPDARLKDHDLEDAVKEILQSTCEVFNGTQHTPSQLHIGFETDKRLSSDMPGWTIKRRGEFVNQVDIFRKVVDTLYDLIPPTNDSESRLFQHASSLMGCIDGKLPNLKWFAVTHLTE